MKILVTAGPTREPIDPVRYVTNRSSGKMGYAVASAAVKAGHDVTLVSGPVTLVPPDGLSSFVSVTTAAEMAEEVKKRFPACDVLVMCAAVADYRPSSVAEHKIKKSDGDLILRLERTEDVLASCGKMKKSFQTLAGFAAETQDLEASAKGKMERKNLDWIVANTVGVEGRGFQADTNAVTVYGRNGEKFDFPVMSKTLLAEKILSIILAAAKEKKND